MISTVMRDLMCCFLYTVHDDGSFNSYALLQGKTWNKIKVEQFIFYRLNYLLPFVKYSIYIEKKKTNELAKIHLDNSSAHHFHQRRAVTLNIFDTMNFIK